MGEWEDCQAFRMGGAVKGLERERCCSLYIVSVFGLVDEVVINYSVEQHRTGTIFQGFH